jgi:hypothetical protein
MGGFDCVVVNWGRTVYFEVQGVPVLRVLISYECVIARLGCV